MEKSRGRNRFVAVREYDVWPRPVERDTRIEMISEEIHTAAGYPVPLAVNLRICIQSEDFISKTVCEGSPSNPSNVNFISTTVCGKGPTSDSS